MTFRTMISSLALVSALALSGPALAQSGDDSSDLRAKCAAVNAAANKSLAEPVENDSDETTGSTDSSDPANEDNEGRLSSLTVEECRRAGY